MGTPARCDLEQRLGQEPLETGLFLELAIQIASIVRSLHQRSVIHRDINPSNLVLQPGTGQLTLIDFGTATKAVGLVGESEGTLPYIAPEQTGRMNRLVDHRADLYALGATFYEMLTGLPPFVSADPVELVHAHLARPPVPPSQLHSSIPSVLSDIVLKLLAKMPEERYQSAEALELDLREAQRQWKDSQAIAPFTLALHDLAHELVISDTLYGREHELTELRDALGRARSGPSQAVLIAGRGRLWQVLARPRAAQAARAKSPVPLRQVRPTPGPRAPCRPGEGAWADSSGACFRSRPPAVLSWRQRLRDALGSQSATLARFIPELARLLGEPPRLDSPRGAELETRFQLAFQAFIQAFATHESPLVLFMDDLQWADMGSLKLLQGLATAPDLRHVLLLGAYRSKEVGPAHRLAQTLEELHAAGVSLPTLAVPPLDLRALTQLCGDTLHSTPQRVEPLAKLLLRKTGGNPFFAKRLLRFLHQSRLAGLRRREARVAVGPGAHRAGGDHRERRRADAAGHSPAPRGHPATPQGGRLLPRPGGSLAAVRRGGEVRPGRSRERSGAAIQEGLLVPASQGPRFAAGAGQAPESSSVQAVSYRFVHDRIQQAAYSLLSDEERRRTHREVGRRLLEGVSQHELDERIFEVADHFDMGLEPSQRLAPSERLQLAELYAHAGSKALATSAFSSALVYLRHGMELLPEEAWRSRPELCLRLHRQAAECAHLTGDHALGEAFIQAALSRVGSDLEKVDLYEVHVISYIITRNYLEAIRWGREGLRMLGEEPPEREPELERALAEESAAVGRLLQGRTREDLLAAPPMKDPRPLAQMRLMSGVLISAYFADQSRLFAFLQARMLHVALEHGHSSYASIAYVTYALTLGQTTGDYNTWMMLGEVGVELSQRYAEPTQESRSLTLFAGGVSPWRAPYRTTLPLLQRAVAAGLEGNEFMFAGFAATLGVKVLFAIGTELPHVLAECEASMVFIQKLGHQDMVSQLRAYHQAIRCLQDRTYQRGSYEDEGFSEKEFLDSIRGSPLILSQYQILRLQTSYLLGDLADALEMSRAAAANFHLLRPVLPLIDHTFYTALTLAALCTTASPSERGALQAQMEKPLRTLATWAQGCPENFRHKSLLVAAELARIEGRQSEAMRLYDSAIDAAHQHEFPQDEALAHDLAGRFYHSLGHRRIAAPYLRAAVKEFARWGAKAKAAALVEEFPELSLARGPPVEDRHHARARGGTRRQTRPAQHPQGRGDDLWRSGSRQALGEADDGLPRGGRRPARRPHAP